MEEKNWKDDVLMLYLENRVEEADQLIKHHIPNSLFKYYSITRFSVNDMKNRNIFLCNPQKYNDPYDSLIQHYFPTARYFLENAMIKLLLKVEDYNTIQEIINEIRCSQITTQEKYTYFIQKLESIKPSFSTKDKEEIENRLKRLKSSAIARYFGDIKNRFYESLFMTCFSEVKNDILMWSHYGKSNTGFCVEYDIKTYLDYINNEKMKLLPVIYKTKMFAYSNYQKCSNTYPQIMIKHELWNYENEWRLIAKNEYADNGFLIIQPKIKNISLGSNFNLLDKENTDDIELKDELLTIFRERSINIKRMRPQDYAFSLDDYDL